MARKHIGFAHELAQRLTQGDAADRELLTEIVLRGDLGSGRIDAAMDAMANQILDLVVERNAEFLPQAAIGRMCCHAVRGSIPSWLTALV
jgi:hypothetical protein